MNSAKMGLSALEPPALRPAVPRCVFDDAEWLVFLEPALDCVLEERRDLVIDPAVAKTRFRSGRSVARHPATMLAPDSMVDHIAMLVAFQKKSSI